jgi:hypothetical protein
MTGCCESSNRFAVLAADTPFVEADFAQAGLPRSFSNSVRILYETGAAYDQGVVEINADTRCRFIRIVNLEDQFLALAEVEIIAPRLTVESPTVQVQVQP